MLARELRRDLIMNRNDSNKCLFVYVRVFYLIPNIQGYAKKIALEEPRTMSERRKLPGENHNSDCCQQMKETLRTLRQREREMNDR